jgi:hypothetical protein
MLSLHASQGGSNCRLTATDILRLARERYRRLPVHLRPGPQPENLLVLLTERELDTLRQNRVWPLPALAAITAGRPFKPTERGT